MLAGYILNIAAIGLWQIQPNLCDSQLLENEAKNVAWLQYFHFINMTEKQNYRSLASFIQSFVFDSIVPAVLHTKEHKDEFKGSDIKVLGCGKQDSAPH